MSENDLNENRPLIFMIEDTKANTREFVWTAANLETAIRWLQEPLYNPNHPYSKFPGDFHLYTIGRWNSIVSDGAPIELWTKEHQACLLDLASPMHHSRSIDDVMQEEEILSNGSLKNLTKETTPNV